MMGFFDMSRGFDRQPDSLRVPWEHDRFLDPTFTENMLEEILDMIKRARAKSGPREQVYTLQVMMPSGMSTVDIIVRRRPRPDGKPSGS